MTLKFSLYVIPVLRHCDVYAVNSVRNLLLEIAVSSTAMTKPEFFQQIVKKSFCLEQFCVQYSAKCCAALCVVAKRNKLYVKHIAWAKASDYASHSFFCLAVAAWLRAVLLVAHNNRMFRRARKIQFLWN